MAINTTTRSAGPYTCDGTVSSFAFSFKVFAAEDVKVTAVDPNAAPGSSVVLVYSVTLNSDQDNFPGGYVVFSPAPSVGTVITIGSQVSAVQTSVFQNLGGFLPKVVENALDRLTILIQQLSGKLARVISLPDSVSTSSVSATFPAPVATNLIGWNDAATALKNYTPAQLLSQLSTANLYGQTSAQSNTGDGSTRSFTLSSSAGNVNNVQLYVGGARLRPTTDYQLGPDGKAVTLTTAPSNGAQVLFVWQSVLPVSSPAFTSEFQTASDGQTVFTLTTVTYAAGSPGALSVFVNGLRVKKGVDYSETSSSVVTFTNGLVAGDDVEFLVGSQVGAQGPAGTIAIGTTTTGAAGSNAAVTNTGTSTAAVLNFTIPTGAQGPAATVSIGTVTTLAPGSSATVTNVGTSGAAVLNFGIPQGAAGSGSGTLTSFTFTNANGFTGTVTNGTSTPTLSLGTSISGLLKGNGTAISAAAAGTDYPGLSTANSYSGVQTMSAGINLSGSTSPLQVGGSAGTAGYVLTSAGAGATPTWAAAGGGGGAWTKISTQTASSSASLAWTGLSGYSRYVLVFENIIAATASGILYAQIGTGAGPTYITSGYVNQLFYSYGATSVTVTNNTSVIYAAGYGAYLPTSGTGGASGKMLITGATAGGFVGIELQAGNHYGASNLEQDSNAVSVSAGAALTAIKLYMSGGNIASGTATLYGIN